MPDVVTLPAGTDPQPVHVLNAIGQRVRLLRSRLDSIEQTISNARERVAKGARPTTLSTLFAQETADAEALIGGIDALASLPTFRVRPWGDYLRQALTGNTVFALDKGDGS